MATLEELRRQVDAAWRPMPVHGRPPLDGLEGTVGCMKCGEMFSMTLGSVLPFISARDSRGFLCLPCLELINRARTHVGLETFPVPLVGYRGAALSDAADEFTHDEWLGEVDGRRLIRFAASRIPAQHLGLVLASVAACGWSHVHRFAPSEWRPALALAALRAWCHGEATQTELESALECLKQLRGSTDRRTNPAAHDAHAAIGCALEAVLLRGTKRAVNAAIAVVENLVCAEVEEADARGVLTRDTRDQKLEATAQLIRQQLPWPATASDRWELTLGLAMSGGAALRIDGWNIGDAVSLEEFGQLSGPRAVAFDAAQVGRSEHVDLLPSLPAIKVRAPVAQDEESSDEDTTPPVQRIVNTVKEVAELGKQVLWVSVGTFFVFSLLVHACSR